MPLWGLTNGVAIASLLGFVSGLCTVEQFPVLFGMECLMEGVGGTFLVPLGGKNCLYISLYLSSLAWFYTFFKYALVKL